MNDGVLSAHVEGYLRRAGWVKSPPGPSGSLWHSQNQGQTIAVPRRLKPDSTEWRGLIERLAFYEHRSSQDIASALLGCFVDVARLRAANDVLISGSIPLLAGHQLVTTAYGLLRSSANTAQIPRAHIAGRYSKVADDIVSSARLGHTEDGSYIIPIMMPMPPPVEEHGTFAADDSEFQRAVYEPSERRVMRTMAEALVAVEQGIIEPAIEPRAADVPALVAAGVSRELIVALEHLLLDDSVSTFSASFEWSDAVGTPARVPSRISMPSDSAELLTKTARLLKSSRRELNQAVTGPIVEVRYVPDDPFGEIAIQTVRHGRPAEVRVRFPSNNNDEMHEWMRTRRTVVAEGVVEQAPARQSIIIKPTGLYPLDTQFLPSL